MDKDKIIAIEPGFEDKVLYFDSEEELELNQKRRARKLVKPYVVLYKPPVIEISEDQETTAGGEQAQTTAGGIITEHSIPEHSPTGDE